MCIWCISTDKTDFLEAKSYKLCSKAFGIAYCKNVIVNKNILNKSKVLSFAFFFWWWGWGGGERGGERK